MSTNPFDSNCESATPKNPFENDNEHKSSNPFDDGFENTHSSPNIDQKLYGRCLPYMRKNKYDLVDNTRNPHHDTDINNNIEIGYIESLEIENEDDNEIVLHEYQPRNMNARESMKRKLQKIDRSWKKNGGDSEVVTINENKPNTVIRFLLSDRLFGYPGSDGSVCSNYYYFVLNKHPFLSIFTAHKLHPFNLRNRLIVFFCLLSVGMFLTVILINSLYLTEKVICNAGCDKTTVYSDDDQQRETVVCTSGANEGMTYDTYKKHCQFTPVWAISLSCGILITVYGSVLKFIATCNCLQGHKTFQGKGTFCGAFKEVLEYFGGKILSGATLVSVALVAWSIYYAVAIKEKRQVLLSFLSSQALSFLYWFAWTAPYFAYKFPKDRKHFYKEVRRKEMMHAPQNEQLE